MFIIDAQLESFLNENVSHIQKINLKCIITCHKRKSLVLSTEYGAIFLSIDVTYLRHIREYGAFLHSIDVIESKARLLRHGSINVLQI